jgi:dienelactone hydrolase
MRLSLAGSLGATILLSAVLSLAAPARAQGLAWLGGDTVQVAAHRMDLAPLPEPSNHPLLGYLARPDMPGRHPAVIVLHGCGGFGTGYPVVADVLKSYGYVALAIDSLGQLNACTRGDGAIAEAFDAYGALDWLAQQNFVDPDRVAVLGFSMGGITTLDAVEAGVGAIAKAVKRHFRAAIAYYPCTRYRAGVMTVPTLILVGDKDDWTPASYCRDMMARRNSKGAPVTLIVYPGRRTDSTSRARHGNISAITSPTIGRPRPMRGGESAIFCTRRSVDRSLPVRRRRAVNRSQGFYHSTGIS